MKHKKGNDDKKIHTKQTNSTHAVTFEHSSVYVGFCSREYKVVSIRPIPFSEDPQVEEDALPGLDLQADSKLNLRLRFYT